ncbi:D-alanyl-D-alanine carboxypeptidase [Bacillus sp. OV322]|uniref:D-alanyl-D-alanine carboxypeptidase family protein n=1 Tax=Bacillus sp. OV322 TaxID=1882764 RepID=UPI0008DFD26E|nr:D-alanyl-D-alanine carboxypeptidase family protein [Bacillus sp. OV322]SFC43827.1 D-alanyl-D-alanine carboxypeptidase [Bacillus sp. OV322]
MRFLNRCLPVLLAAVLFLSFYPLQPKAASGVTAHSAILMDQESGRVLFEKNAHEKSRIASITKIMTAILAVESGKMNKTVTVSDNAVGTEGSSLYLKYGEKIKLRDLVYGLMLRSGNDAAVAIAEEVGGSLDGFVWMMNQKAEEIGMKDSHFTNPHGLDNTKDHYSSAYDMALLTRYAMQNSTYKKIAGTKIHKARNSMETWDYVWKNKNKLLTQLYEYCTGGKTGYTKLAKRTLVTTASKNGLHLVAVTLNGPDDWNDHIHMYESSYSTYKPAEILSKGEITGVKAKPYKGNIYYRNSFTYPLLKKEHDKITVEMKMLKPQKSWEDKKNIPEIVGKAVIYLDGRVIGVRSIFYGKHQEAFKQQSFQASWLDLLKSFLGISHHG